MPTSRVLAARFAGLAAIALAIAALLMRLPGHTPPTDPAALTTWWEGIGTPTATMAIARTISLILAGWLLCVSSIGFLAVLSDSRHAVRLVLRVSPTSLRRALLASTVAVSASTPTLAWGAEERDPAPVLRDLGPVDGAQAGGDESDPTGPVLVDLGPLAGEDPPTLGLNAPTPPAADPGDDNQADDSPADDSAPTDTWTVARGDHLWHVAEETLRDRGEPVDHATTALFWRRIIELNAGTIGNNPDLIHPGIVLTLPE